MGFWGKNLLAKEDQTGPGPTLTGHLWKKIYKYILSHPPIPTYGWSCPSILEHLLPGPGILEPWRPQRITLDQPGPVLHDLVILAPQIFSKTPPINTFLCHLWVNALQSTQINHLGLCSKLKTNISYCVIICVLCILKTLSI